MQIQDVYRVLEEQTQECSEEFKRVFHGRGGAYKGFRHLSIDSIGTILSVALYFDEPNESALIEMLIAFVKESKYQRLLIQRRYLKGAPSELLLGELPQDMYILENGIKIKVNLLNNQNSGYFADMKNGRSFVRENAKDKRVLNLFAYTCAFSLAAKFGGAYEVVNVDMSKGALKLGMANHSLNNLEPRGVSYLPYNILKSLSALKRKGPFDLIIIDPPTFQKGSFEVTKDYIKIIKKLPEIASEEALLLACLNAPNLESDFLIELIREHAPCFEFVKRLDNLAEFASEDEAKSLKNLTFKRVAL